MEAAQGRNELLERRSGRLLDEWSHQAEAVCRARRHRAEQAVGVQEQAHQGQRQRGEPDDLHQAEQDRAVHASEK